MLEQETVRTLLDALGSNKGMERKSARETLVLCGETAEPQLRSLLTSKDKRLRWEAAKALAAMVEPASLPALVGLLRDEQPELRWLAADGLIGLGPRSVIPVLESLLQAPPTKGQVQMAGRVLRALAAENDVLREIVSAVTAALSDMVTREVLEPRVSEALTRLERVAGRLPEA